MNDAPDGRRQKQTEAQSEARCARFEKGRTSSPPRDEDYRRPPPRDYDYYDRPPPPRDGGHYRPPPPRDDMGPAFAYADYMLDKFTGLASRDYYRRPPPPRDEDYYRRPPPPDYYRPPPRDYDDAPADIGPTIDHINARRIHYRNKAATSGSDSKAIAAEARMKAFANREIDAAQEMTNGPPPRPPANPGNAPPPTPDQVELAKCRRALAAAKRALEDNAPLEPSSPAYVWASARARAASALAEITKALEGEER